jgi:outer membrane phospholipase A
MVIWILSAIFAALPAPAQSNQNPATSSSVKVDREDGSILQRHHPFYFVYGEPLSKLQVSFKTPVLRDSHFYFAYTQVMFWALNEDSKPFRDLTYNPELFYRWQQKRWTYLKSIDFGFWGHTSNGRQGPGSRSFDEKYVRFNYEREGNRWLTRLGLQGSYLHGFDPTNRDIHQNVGPLSLSLSFIQLFDAWFDKSEVALSARPGGKFADRWDLGGYQVSWSFRLGAVKLVPAFYLQYYYGHAETLLNYDRHVREFRGGVIF